MYVLIILVTYNGIIKILLELIRDEQKNERMNESLFINNNIIIVQHIMGKIKTTQIHYGKNNTIQLN